MELLVAVLDAREQLRRHAGQRVGGTGGAVANSMRLGVTVLGRVVRTVERRWVALLLLLNKSEGTAVAGWPLEELLAPGVEIPSWAVGSLPDSPEFCLLRWLQYVQAHRPYRHLASLAEVKTKGDEVARLGGNES